MRKILTILGVCGLSVTVAACQSTGDFSALSTISEECRTAYNCLDTTEGDSRVVVDERRTTKAKRVFDYSLRK